MTVDFSQQRENMIEGQLRTQDVTNVRLIEAVRSIPREEFVPGRRKALSYIDEDLEVAAASGGMAARYLMQPAQFGKLVQLAKVKPPTLFSISDAPPVTRQQFSRRSLVSSSQSNATRRWRKVLLPLWPS